VFRRRGGRYFSWHGWRNEEATAERVGRAPCQSRISYSVRLRNGRRRIEFSSTHARAAVAAMDVLSVELSVIVVPAGGTAVTVAAAPAMEWADPPALPIVSSERLLRSSGKIRILAGLGSVHPLRGQ
jgi:hypothetical protein